MKTKMLFNSFHCLIGIYLFLLLFSVEIKGQVNYTEADLSGNKQGSVNSPFSFNPWQIRTFRMDVSGKK